MKMPVIVLIETLWNVKSEKYLIYEIESYVLIETLWNVKVCYKLYVVASTRY